MGGPACHVTGMIPAILLELRSCLSGKQITDKMNVVANETKDKEEEHIVLVLVHAQGYLTYKATQTLHTCSLTH